MDNNQQNKDIGNNIADNDSEQKNIKKALLKKSTLAIMALTYVTMATLPAQAIFSPNNLAAPDLTSKLILLFVVLFVFAPFYSLASIGIKLRIEHLIKTKDINEYLLPKEGSLGNPNIDFLLGSNGEKIFKKLQYILLAILIFVFGFGIYNGIKELI